MSRPDAFSTLFCGLTFSITAAAVSATRDALVVTRDRIDQTRMADWAAFDALVEDLSLAIAFRDAAVAEDDDDAAALREAAKVADALTSKSRDDRESR